MRCVYSIALVLAMAAASLTTAMARDDLLETLAQKGILTVDEYQKLKAQRKTEATLNTDDGFRIVSADGTTSMQIGTMQQLDYSRYARDQAPLSDGTELRRSRISVAGTFLSDWQYRAEYDFGATSGITDAYVAYTGRKPVVVTLGQFKQPFGMEALASDKNVTFMERALPFAFVGARAPGIMLGSSGSNWSANGGVFSEPFINAQAGNDGYGAVARATYAPLLAANRMIHLGLGVSWRKPTANNSTNTTGAKFSTVRFRSKPESNILAQRLVDTGEIRDVDHYEIAGLELAAQSGALSLQTEYHLVQVQRGTVSSLNFSGWYAQLAYSLTGEARPYRADRGFFDGIRPKRNFSGSSGWGAFEVALRLSDISLSDGNVAGGQQRDATAALNWYLNPILRVSANVVKVLSVTGGAMNGDEPTVVQLRAQLSL
jgi:phosphate-selective porin OprO and OprP